MTLRGEIEAFPLETVVQLIHSTSKTGQLEVRANDSTGGTLGFDGGRLVAAISGDDVGEPALGAVFAVSQGAFEFIPWTDAPAANLSGDLDQLLDKAVEERDRIVAIRALIPNDRSRFRLSERAADKGNITLSSDQWRTLLAVNGDRDVSGVADHLKSGTLVTRASLAALVEAGFIDVLPPSVDTAPPPVVEAPPPPPVVQAAPPPPEPEPPQPEPEPAQWAPPAREWTAPVLAPEPAPAPPPPVTSWEPPAPTPTQSWEPPAPPAPAQSWERPATDIREDLAAALDARMGALSSAPAAPEVAPAPPAVETPPPPLDDRLAALSGVFAPPQPQVTEAPPPPAPTQDRISEWSRHVPAQPAEEVEDKKKKGPFGFLKRDDMTAEADAVAVASAPPAAPAEPGRAGQVASLANALLGEYNSGRYGKGRLDDRMANLLMRVDEQADPIDRPLPIVDDRIDSQALDRENVPEEQAIPYLALLVTQIYDDAARTFGKDKAKKGYKAAQQQVFGSDAGALGADVAARLPRV